MQSLTLAGGMPEMTFEYALKRNKIDPKKDLNIDTSIAFSAMQGAFIGGTGDFVTLFEPNALNIEKQGLGYVVASVGSLAGSVPYTAFNAQKSFIENNPDIIRKFKKALQKGIDFTYENDNNTIAKAISNQFVDTKIDDLTNIVKRYKDNDSWYDTTKINKSDFEHILDIINNDDLKANYNKLVK